MTKKEQELIKENLGNYELVEMVKIGKFYVAYGHDETEPKMQYKIIAISPMTANSYYTGELAKAQKKFNELQANIKELL